MELKVEPVWFKDVLRKPKISPYGSGCFAVILGSNHGGGR